MPSSGAEMKQGYLAGYFSGVAAKLLSAVEVSPERSHQHEFNGSAELIRLLGQAGRDKRRYAARFLYLEEDADQRVTDHSEVTWYDARAKSAAKTGRTEHRLYFPGNDVAIRRAQEGDLLLIALCRDGSLLAVIAEAESSISMQLHWLFGLPNLAENRVSASARPLTLAQSDWGSRLPSSLSRLGSSLISVIHAIWTQ